jgi:hypothetical protein
LNGRVRCAATLPRPHPVADAKGPGPAIIIIDIHRERFPFTRKRSRYFLAINFNRLDQIKRLKHQVNFN